MPSKPKVSRRDVARWQRRDRFERRASALYSRAKKLNGGKPNGRVSGAQLRAQLEAQADPAHPGQYLCGLCGESFPPEPLQVDHRLPLTAPGGVNAGWNVHWVCAPCNRAKGDLSVDQYKLYLALRALPPEEQAAAALKLLAFRAEEILAAAKAARAAHPPPAEAA